MNIFWSGRADESSSATHCQWIQLVCAHGRRVAHGCMSSWPCRDGCLCRPDMLTKKLLHRRLRRQSLRIFCHKGIKFACVSIVWRLFQSSRCALPVSVWANMERSVLILSALLEQSRLETLVGCALWGIHNWFFRALGLPPILQIRNLLHILVDLPRFFSYHYFYCS